MSVSLLYGDCRDHLSGFPQGTFDMAYMDPPYGNRQIWTAARGSFSDRHSESERTEAGWRELERIAPWCAAALRVTTTARNDRAYLGFMAGAISAVRSVLKATATLWVQFDDTMGAQLRILCDGIFGPDHALGTIVWKRTHSHSQGGKGYGRVHDTIAVYGRTRAARWRLWRCGKFAGDPCDPNNPVRCSDFIDDCIPGRSAKEFVGYPTQKPIALLTRFIEAATLPGALVLDPMCGSGTTGVACLQLGRSFVGIDASEQAIAVARERLGETAPRPRRTKSTSDLPLFAAGAA
jgi:DNA modification methylase